MITQNIWLDKYGWYTTVYYTITDVNKNMILSDLINLGCGDEDIIEINDKLSPIQYNTGFIYSNLNKRRSIMVIGPTTSASEFQNTFDHEKGHLAVHIAEALDIDMKGEEFQYLTGEIGEKLFAIAQMFLCDKNGKDIRDLFSK